MDVFVEAGDGLVAVAEAKASDWDAISDAAVRRNVRRQARQVWDYVESQLEQGRDVSPGIIFPKRPKQPERVELMEALFEEEGIAVVWEDEPAAERKARA